MKLTDIELTALIISNQADGWPFCPRCGHMMKIDEEKQRPSMNNALSRHADGVYICDQCGINEALRAFASSPLPFDEWNLVKIIRIAKENHHE